MHEDEEDRADDQSKHDSEEVKDLKVGPKVCPVAHKRPLLHRVFVAVYILVKLLHRLLKHVQLCILALPNGDSLFAARLLLFVCSLK